ncbi:MAG: IS1182 family transposase [Planctomycetota bacterium]|nr:MAG: IS1182 family transposase [Planctomycetota bacterium]
MDWAKAEFGREQLVLFPTRLDEAIAPQHRVRLLDEILTRLDWSAWEAQYDLRRGQPPIHPRILAGVILYGLLVRIRASRALEEALQVRLDFRWLAEGRSIDHTTLSEFRRKNAEALKSTFVQIALVAREIGCLPLQTLAFDGTRIRANNRRRGTRTPAELREMRAELAQKFTELEAAAAAADLSDDERLGEHSAHTLAAELADVERRTQQVDAALAELERIERSAQAPPKRLPLTDPQSRVMPNKEGGYAPNFTPTAMVDVDSGMIVAADVLNTVNEDKQLVPSVEQVQQDFGQEKPSPTVLADGLMATGENLADCEQAGVELFSPIKNQAVDNNPAVRDDPTQPVAAADRDRLPTKSTTRQGVASQQLDKQAFVYDEDEDCYWCPQGKRLPHRSETTETRNGVQRIRHRYQAAAQDCADCPLKSLCLQGQATPRTIHREQHESRREAHAAKMSTAEAQQTYARRRHPGERPFAVIKQKFGVRQFLLRGLEPVWQEWTWLATAFNLDRLLNLIPARAGPFTQSQTAPVHPP